jgi:hypothetical protein
MIFPRTVVRVGGCLAVADKDGSPIIKAGYKYVNFEGECWPAHRLSFNLNTHPIPRAAGRSDPEKAFVLHRCNHKWCIEPSHLYLGNTSQNFQDFLAVATEEQRSAMANGFKGRKHSESTKMQIKSSLSGKQRSEEIRAKISSSLSGRKHTEEAREKMRQARKAR